MSRAITNESPLVLVDIDGVCNILAHTLESHQSRTRIGRYTITLDNRHPQWFAELSEFAELRWATMWHSNAARDFAPVAGFGADWDFLDFNAWYAEQPLHVIRQARTGAGVGNFKDPMIRAAGESGRPMIWIDDDMVDSQILWAIERSQKVAPTLFIRPDATHGLTRAQFNRIMDFCMTYSTERIAA